MNSNRDRKGLALQLLCLVNFTNARIPLHFLNLKIIFQLFIFEWFLLVIGYRNIALTQRNLDVARCGITGLGLINLHRILFISRKWLDTLLLGLVHGVLKLLAIQYLELFLCLGFECLAVVDVLVLLFIDALDGVVEASPRAEIRMRRHRRFTVVIQLDKPSTILAPLVLSRRMVWWLSKLNLSKIQFFNCKFLVSHLTWFVTLKIYRYWRNVLKLMSGISSRWIQGLLIFTLLRPFHLELFLTRLDRGFHFTRKAFLVFALKLVGLDVFQLLIF